MADDPIDSDGDGKITTGEIRSYLRENGGLSLSTDLSASDAEPTEAANKWLKANLGTISLVVDIVLGFISDLKDWVWGIIRDMYKGFYFIPVAIVSIIGAMFLGGDLAVREQVTGFPGFADMPVLVANIFVAAGETVATPILEVVTGTNLMLVETVTAEAEFLAAPLLAGIQIVEIGVLLYLLWTGVTLASSIPGVATVVAAGRVAAKPFRVALEAIR